MTHQVYDHKNIPIMACGCAGVAQCRASGGVEFDPPIHSCITHSCHDVAEEPPDLGQRTARCTYYGQTPGRRSDCVYSQCKRDKPCQCEQPSSSALPFFEHHPTEDYDRFYCGCAFGWD
ncbi:MAG: hypothetical protein GY838_13475 [bacterium]|nr:hypothetical protein [bacterium]